MGGYGGAWFHCPIAEPVFIQHAHQTRRLFRAEAVHPLAAAAQRRLAAPTEALTEDPEELGLGSGVT